MTSHIAYGNGALPAEAFAVKESCVTDDEWAELTGGKPLRLVCSNCSKSGKLFRCAGCHQCFYCSRECQRANWQAHRTFCRDFRNTTDEVQLTAEDSIERDWKRWFALRKVLVDTGAVAALELYLDLSNAERMFIELEFDGSKFGDSSRYSLQCKACRTHSMRDVDHFGTSKRFFDQVGDVSASNGVPQELLKQMGTHVLFVVRFNIAGIGRITRYTKRFVNVANALYLNLWALSSDPGARSREQLQQNDGTAAYIRRGKPEEVQKKRIAKHIKLGGTIIGS